MKRRAAGSGFTEAPWKPALPSGRHVRGTAQSPADGSDRARWQAVELMDQEMRKAGIGVQQ